MPIEELLKEVSKISMEWWVHDTYYHRQALFLCRVNFVSPARMKVGRMWFTLSQWWGKVPRPSECVQKPKQK